MRAKTASQRDQQIESLHNNLYTHGWMYLSTIVDIVRKPILILNEDHEVISGNQAFKNLAHTRNESITGINVFDLAEGIFNTPELKRRLNHVGNNPYTEGVQINHDFLHGERKTLVVHVQKMYVGSGKMPHAYILLTFDDVTDMTVTAQVISNHIRETQLQNSITIERLKAKIQKLEKEIRNYKRS